MKKLFPLAALSATALSLSACRVNGFNGQSYDVPWFVIALFILAIFLITYTAMILSHYTCPKCGTVFRPKWYQLSVCLHLNGARFLRCPHCGHKGFCQQKR